MVRGFPLISVSKYKYNGITGVISSLQCNDIARVCVCICVCVFCMYIYDVCIYFIFNLILQSNHYPLLVCPWLFKNYIFFFIWIISELPSAINLTHLEKGNCLLQTGLWLCLNCWLRRVYSIPGIAIPRQVGLGCLRGSKPVSNIPPWFLPQVTALSSSTTDCSLSD